MLKLGKILVGDFFSPAVPDGEPVELCRVLHVETELGGHL